MTEVIVLKEKNNRVKLFRKNTSFLKYDMFSYNPIKDTPLSRCSVKGKLLTHVEKNFFSSSLSQVHKGDHLGYLLG